MFYVIENRADFTVPQDRLAESRQAAEDDGTILVSDTDWMLVNATFEQASKYAALQFSKPMPAKAGSFMDAGGAVVYIDDDGRQVNNAVDVLRSLADNGDADAREFFESYTEDAYGDYADEILAIMGRAF
jgi:hypothetical protein